MKYLIVGLGNIGEEYENTRHNIGFKVADAIAEEADAKFSTERYASVAQIKYKGRSLLIAKPTTYMNLSGKAVRYWMNEEKISIENTIVVVDDLALPFGKLRLKSKGSDAGHNGLKDIQATLGTNQYPRLRFGIGDDFAKGRQIEYVLGQWSKEEAKLLAEKIDICSSIIKSFATIGIAKTMSQFNSK